MTNKTLQVIQTLHWLCTQVDQQDYQRQVHKRDIHCQSVMDYHLIISIFNFCKCKKNIVFLSLTGSVFDKQGNSVCCKRGVCSGIRHRWHNIRMGWVIWVEIKTYLPYVCFVLLYSNQLLVTTVMLILCTSWSKTL